MWSFSMTEYPTQSSKINHQIKKSFEAQYLYCKKSPFKYSSSNRRSVAWKLLHVLSHYSTLVPGNTSKQKSKYNSRGIINQTNLKYSIILVLKLLRD